MLAGGTAGCVMWAIVMPLDVAKTRIQTSFPGSLHHEPSMLKQWQLLFRVRRRPRLIVILCPAACSPAAGMQLGSYASRLGLRACSHPTVFCILCSWLIPHKALWGRRSTMLYSSTV